MNPEAVKAVLTDLHRRRIPGDLKRAVELLLDKKGLDLVLLKLKGEGEMADYLLLASGESARQNRAMADSLIKQLSKERQLSPYGYEGAAKGDWILIDYVEFVVHLFLPEVRKRYALEKLWMDARRHDFSPRD
ncbi:MAG TPA: ribosome silencing factor [Candidatus Aminicenantes bacterium]|nr:ribosome silencing factor [Candidatus Aminicenantes bacterium]